MDEKFENKKVEEVIDNNIQEDDVEYADFDNVEVEEHIEVESDIKDKITYTKEFKIPSGIIGFIGGIIGTIIILVAILNIPYLKNILLKQLSSNNSNVVQFEKYDNPVVAIAEKVGPAIVGIKVNYEMNSYFGIQKLDQEGSGIIIRQDGYILTNNHVVDVDSRAQNVSMKVYLQNSEEPFEAKIIGKDEQTDLAIIKIECTDLVVAELGDSEKSKVGELAVAIGNPLGLEFAGTVTVGYISAVNREVTDEFGRKFVLIQTDAAINSGNSGGALVDSSGKVIGINTIKIGGTGVEGLGFAIPINSAKPIIDDLIKFNKVLRPYIGIQCVTVDNETSKSYDIPVGVYVKVVEDFSAAEKAGLKPGDVIIKIQETEVKTVEEFNKIKEQYKIGDTIKVTIIRDEKEKVLSIKLQEQIEKKQ